MPAGGYNVRGGGFFMSGGGYTYPEGGTASAKFPVLNSDGGTDVFYYPFDETAQNFGATCTDLVGGVNLTNASLATQPRYGGGPNRISNGRCFFPDFFLANTANAGASAGLFQGSWSQSFYIRVNQLPATTRIIMLYGVDGAESLASNIQASIRFNVSGFLQCLHEFGAGATDEIATQNTGTALLVDEDHHVCVVKRVAAYEFWIDGVLQQSIAIVNQPSGGTSGVWRFGLPTGSAGSPGFFTIKDWRIDNVALLQAQIQADAARITTTTEQEQLATTVNFWRFNEAPDVRDLAGNAPLFARSTTETVPIPGGLLVPATGSQFMRAFTGNDGSVIPITGESDTACRRIATALRGNFTFDCLLQLAPSASATTRGFFVITSAAAEAVSSNYYVMFVTLVSIANGYTFSAAWEESAAGTDRSYTSANNTITFAEASNQAGVHLAVTKVVTAGNAVHKVYVNGALRATSGNVANYDGTGTAVDMTFAIGDAGSLSAALIGNMQLMRLKSTALDDAGVATMYQSLRGGISNR